MHNEQGIEQFDHPLTFHVQSNTDPWTWYQVDLFEVGSEHAPKGQCDCIAGMFATLRIARGDNWKMCDHLERVRALVAERVHRGEYDEYLTTL